MLSYTNDIFFHYALSGEDKVSVKLRELLIYEILGQHYKTKILNPALVPKSKNDKYPILDILAMSDTGEMFNIEMQVSLHTEKQSKRFQYYGARTLATQLEEGDDYDKLKRVIQIIFIKDKSDELIKLYTSKDSHGKEEKECLIYRYYIYFPLIKDILEVKKVNELSEIEKLCYLFMYNQKDDILIDNEGLVDLMSQKYDKIRESSAIWSIAQHREDQIRYTKMMEEDELQRKINIERLKKDEKERIQKVEMLKEDEKKHSQKVEMLKENEKDREVQVEKLKIVEQERKQNIEALEKTEKEHKQNIDSLRLTEKEHKQNIEKLKLVEEETKNHLENLDKQAQQISNSLEELKKEEQRIKQYIEELKKMMK